MLSLVLAVALQAAPAQLTIEVAPPESELFVDGKKKGKAKKPFVLKLAPGRHEIKVVYKGDSHSEEIALKAGEKKTWKWEFEGVEAPKKKEPEPPTDEAGDKAPAPAGDATP